MGDFKYKIAKALVEKQFIEKVVTKIDKYLSIFTVKILSLSTPIRNNKIIFMTFQGAFTCNAKYIAEEIVRQNLPWDIVFVMNKTNYIKYKNNPEFLPNIRVVERCSYEFYLECLSAKVWIDNAHNFFWEDVPKKRDQIMINTWHGSMGLKRINPKDDKNITRVKKASRCDKDTDFLISNSDFENQVYRETYWPTRKILKFGHPRNDMFINKDLGLVHSLKEKIALKYGFDKNLKIALYAPTFRDNKTLECYSLDYISLKNALERKFGSKWVILVKYHFHVAEKVLDKGYIIDENVINATDYEDIQELMLVSDVGITDYSSWICDYVLTRKIGFIFATDIDLYNTERGLYYPLESTPFPIATTNEEMEKIILSFDEEKYRIDVETFLKEKGCVEDGMAAKRVVKKLIEIIGRKD